MSDRLTIRPVTLTHLDCPRSQPRSHHGYYAYWGDNEWINANSLEKPPVDPKKFVRWLVQQEIEPGLRSAFEDAFTLDENQAGFQGSGLAFTDRAAFLAMVKDVEATAQWREIIELCEYLEE